MYLSFHFIYALSLSDRPASFHPLGTFLWKQQERRRNSSGEYSFRGYCGRYEEARGSRWSYLGLCVRHRVCRSHQTRYRPPETPILPHVPLFQLSSSSGQRASLPLHHCRLSDGWTRPERSG